MVVPVPVLRAGCASSERLRDLQQAQTIVQHTGFLHQHIDVPPFVLTAFVKYAHAEQDWAVFIEGDGYAWRTRN